jgi:2-iminoacetate synthase ThiH
VSALVRDAIDAAGLSDVLAERLRGANVEGSVDRLRDADILALGALADRIRASEVGDEVRIYVREASRDASPLASRADRELAATEPSVSPADGGLTGSDLLREVALRRIVGPPGAPVRVDWTRCGLELAQVALWFGANELTGTIATKRGTLIVEGELLGVGKKSRHELALQVKRKELAACVRRSGRVPVFVAPDGREESDPGPRADGEAAPRQGGDATCGGPDSGDESEEVR